MRLLKLLVCLLLACVLSACEEKVQAPEPLKVPLTDQDIEWKAYVQEVAKSNKIKGKTKGIYVRFLGTTEDPSRHLKDTINIFQRGVEFIWSIEQNGAALAHHLFGLNGWDFHVRRKRIHGCF